MTELLNTLSVSDDNHHIEPGDRSNYTVREQIHSICYYLDKYNLSEGLLEVDKKWSRNHKEPDSVYFLSTWDVYCQIRSSILEVYFKYIWESEAVDDNNVGMYAFMDAQDVEKLDILWWCYRELSLAEDRIYKLHEKYY